MISQQYNIYTDNLENSSDIIENIRQHLSIKSVNEIPSSEIDNIPDNKNTILLTKNKSRFLRTCPGTKNYICCGYYVLKTTYNCNINCSYCTLQEYFGHKYISHFYNYKDLFQELDDKLSRKNKRFRIGTGEFTDSNFIDYYSGLNQLLIKQFNKYDNAVLELKSKLCNIKDIVDTANPKSIIFAWSLNTNYIKNKYEKQADDMITRIKTAKYAQEKGFDVGLHFDPIILYNNCKQDYSVTLDYIKKELNPEKIIWISLGTLRYKGILEQYFLSHNLPEFVYDEFINGNDSKKRYISNKRIEIYRYIYNFLKEWDKDIFVYLCMESDSIWQKSFGWSPQTSENLKKIMDTKVNTIKSM